MSSLLRHFEVSVKSFVENIVLQLPSKPDFIGHFPKKSRNLENLKAIDYLSNYVNIKKIHFEEDPPFSFTAEKFCKNANQVRESNRTMVGNFYQWYNMQKCSELKDTQEVENQTLYDMVIWARPDLYYFNKLENIEQLENRFWLVGHDNHLCGLNDRFCLGSSIDMKNRMNILTYFINEWYPQYSEDESILFSGKIGIHKNKAPQWNPEIVYKTYIRQKLNLHTGKLNLCFGKMRSDTDATIPYYFSEHGNDYTGFSCEEDLVNTEVNSKLKKFVKSGSFSNGSSWGTIDINQWENNER